MSSPAFPTEPFAAPTRIDLGAIPLAVIRHRGLTMDRLPAVFDEGFPALGRLLDAGTVAPIGPAVAVYQGDPAAVFDLELG